VIGAAWRGYSTRRMLRSSKQDEIRIRTLEKEVHQASLMREAQEQASRFLWEEVKTLRQAQAQSDARLAELQTRCDREVQRSQQLAEQLHLIARTPTTLALTKLIHPPSGVTQSTSTPLHPTALSALQQLASMDFSDTSLLKQQHPQTSAAKQAKSPRSGATSATTSAVDTPSPSLPKFDANEFLSTHSEGNDGGSESTSGSLKSIANASSAPPLSSSPITTRDSNTSQVVSHLEASPLRFSKLFVDVLAGRDLAFPSSNIDEESMQMHPYAVVTCQTSRGETEAEENTSEPEWITNFVLDVDPDIAFTPLSRPGADLTCSHVAVTVLSKGSASAPASPSDQLLGSVLIPLADLHSQLPTVAWFPLHGRVKDARSPKGSATGVIKPRGGMVQLSLIWLHSLSDLAASMIRRTPLELQQLFTAVDVSQLLLQVHSADLTRVWSDTDSNSDHSDWSPPTILLTFQGKEARTTPGHAVNARDEQMQTRLARTQPSFDVRTFSFDVDSTGDLFLSLSVHRSLHSSHTESEQLLATAKCSIESFVDQRTRSVVITLQHPFTNEDIGSVHVSIMWMHQLTALIQQLQQIQPTR
jgi:hypothetical protein